MICFIRSQKRSGKNLNLSKADTYIKLLITLQKKFHLAGHVPASVDYYPERTLFCTVSSSAVILCFFVIPFRVFCTKY